MAPTVSAADIARFNSLVDRTTDPSGCWEWTGGRSNGYGRLTVNHRSLWAHRFAWQVAHGPIPDGMFVCHRCDNPPCVRPDHLFLGTPADNNADMARKGRAQRKGQSLPGESHPAAKLTEAQVCEIRSLYGAGGITHTELAGRYGLSRRYIGDIISGRNWAHVGGA